MRLRAAMLEVGHLLYTRSMSVASESAEIADWVSAIGQALGALFTALAVGVALWIARRDSTQKARDDTARSWTQARLVLVSASGGILERENGKELAATLVTVCNLGDRPILDVALEAIVERNAKIVTEVSERIQFVMPDQDPAALTLALQSGDAIRRWRVVWMDADGLDWEVIAPNGRAVHRRRKIHFYMAPRRLT